MAAAASAARCFSPGVWYRFPGATPQPVSGLEVIQQAARADVVLLGEEHDNPDHHRWQLQTLAGLHLLRPDMVIGFEAFPRRLQPILDRWIAGELTQAQFLEQSEWKRVWGFPAELYLPLFHLARLNRIPMIALNVERSLISAVSSKGWDQVAPQDREGVSRPAPASREYEDALFETFKLHAAGEPAAVREAATFRRFVEAQTTWDRAMAEALAKAVTVGRSPGPLAVGIMGAGHVREGYGVPRQLRALGIRKITTLLPIESGGDCNGSGSGLADAVFALPRFPPEKPPADR